MALRSTLEFRDLLTIAGLDPKEVKLIRHQGNVNGTTPWSLWIARDGRFETYQSIQSRAVFEVPYIASFVVMPDGRTLFVGIWKVENRSAADPEVIDPLRDTPVGDKFSYSLSLTAGLAEHIGRLVVAWPPGRLWHRRAHKDGYTVEELRPGGIDLPFPGFLEFSSPIGELAHIPATWRTALESASGVYLLTDAEDGAQYVGSAYGTGGFLGRWRAYMRNGHADNTLLKRRAPRQYVVTILEVTSTAASWDQIVSREALWKNKLGSRAHGLNAN